MTENYFKTLLVCVIASVVMLSASTAFKLSPWLVMMGGIVPLLYYHLLYLKPLAQEGLSQAAIDSVYYFGFLVTVSALGISAISIAFDGASANLNTVIYQFGIGLFATGYAVVARMHLSSLSAALSEVNQEVLTKRYIKRSTDLINEIDMAASSLSEFSKSIMERTVEVTEAANAAAQRSMIDMAKSFEDEMKFSISLAREGLSEIRNLVHDTAFANERIELQQSIKGTINAAHELNAALSDLTSNVRAGSESAAQSVSIANNLTESLGKITSNIQDFSGEEGALATAAQGLKDSSSALDHGSKSLISTMASITELTEGLSSTAQSSAEFAKRIIASTSKIQSPTEKLENLFVVAGNLDTVFDSLVGHFEELAVVIKSTHTAIEESTKEIKQSINSSAQLLESDVQRSTQAAALLTDRLIQVAQNIIDSTRKIQGVSS